MSIWHIVLVAQIIEAVDYGLGFSLIIVLFYNCIIQGDDYMYKDFDFCQSAPLIL